MTTEQPDQAEPSMEEILASIRQIIASDTPPQAAKPAEEEVLELTEVVEELEPEAEPEPAPQSEPETPPAPEPVAPTVESLMAELDRVDISALAAEDSLVAPAAAAASAGAFAALSEQLAQNRITLPANAELGDGTVTLEQLVAGIMRPLLKEWLDANLPATVERLVQHEIERIARKHRD
jgi:uncharacterized protein